tara:strand:+ start:2797 stop:2955 length:159 start_codon:yes stop_codon:yes gene_type:complete
VVVAGELLETAGALAFLKPADDLINLEVNIGLVTLPLLHEPVMVDATAASVH